MPAANQGPLQNVEEAKQNLKDLATTGSILEANATDARWAFPDQIDASRWNKSYPYQLLILQRQGQGYGPFSKFTLPIPPQDLTVTTPFAIQTTTTLGGILEEHNGAPMRSISFTGTTGVLPLRGTTAVPKSKTLLQGIFGGTLQAVSNTVSSFNKLIGGTDGGNPNLVSETNLATGEEGRATGYFQFRLLQQFLERYVNLKKGTAGRDYRLALAIWKDEAIYLVTPQVFDVRRSAQDPWSYNYSISFRAWGRITDFQSPDDFQGFTPVTRDANKFAQLLTKIQEARDILQGAKTVIEAVRGDVDYVLFEPLRELTLFAKDALAVPFAAADLPANIIRDMKGAVLEALSLQNAPAGIKAAFAAAGEQIKGDLESLAVVSGKSESNNGDGTNQAALSGAHEGNTPFDNPDDYFDFFSALRPSELNLSATLKRRIDTERLRVKSLTRLDFEKMRDSFIQVAADFGDAIGAGSTTYNAIYGRSSPKTVRSATDDDFEVLYNLNQVAMELNRLSASGLINNTNMTSIEYMAGLARRSGMAFQVPQSKFAVPFPYGSTLEQLAAQYLGDSTRWMEIAALNGLRDPYVDEEGFSLQLVTNGRANQVVVSDRSKLYQGQSVWISSNDTSRTKRRIIKIDAIGSGTVALTLDGDGDLDRYSTLAQAQLQAFLPDTVNSQQLIYIPSQEPESEEDFRVKAIPGLDEFDQYLQVGGVDLLLTSTGDLAVTPDGDCRLAIGLTNLIQRLRIGLNTPKRSLIRHPGYGVGLQIGQSTADLSAQEILAGMSELVSADSAFSGIASAAISKQGPVASVFMSVGVTGTSQLIPVSFEIRK